MLYIYIVLLKLFCNIFDDELITACANMLQEWNPNPPPQWVACVPSLNRPQLVSSFAQKLAQALNLPFITCIFKVRPNREQKDMDNSYHQVKNLDGVFAIDEACLANLKGPCLLVDDVVNSGWTFTVVSALLRQAGCAAVYPMGLALNSPKMD